MYCAVACNEFSSLNSKYIKFENLLGICGNQNTPAEIVSNKSLWLSKTYLNKDDRLI